MKISLSWEDSNTLYCAFDGLWTWEELNARLEEGLRAGATRVILDWHGGSYVPPEALHNFSAMCHRVTQNGRTLILVTTNRLINSVYEVSARHDALLAQQVRLTTSLDKAYAMLQVTQ